MAPKIHEFCANLKTDYTPCRSISKIIDAEGTSTMYREFALRYDKELKTVMSKRVEPSKKDFEMAGLDCNNKEQLEMVSTMLDVPTTMTW